MNDAEREVRAVWEQVDFSEGPYTCVVYRHDPDTIETIHGLGNGATPDSAWQAAFAFTRKRQQEIAEIEEEIAVMNEGLEAAKEEDLAGIQKYTPAFKRILSRLSREREELRRGMR